jgi:hypothetical protein
MFLLEDIPHLVARTKRSSPTQATTAVLIIYLRCAAAFMNARGEFMLPHQSPLRSLEQMLLFIEFVNECQDFQHLIQTIADGHVHLTS